MRSKNVLTFPLKKQARKTFLSKIIEFFPTPQGRKVSEFLIGTVGVGALAITYLPQSILFEQYRKHFLDPIKTDITPEDLTDEMKQRIDKAKSKLRLQLKRDRMVDSFTVAGFDIREYGALLSIFHGWVGVPANYFYKTADDIDKQKLLIRNAPIEWDGSVGQQLQDSLVLTEAEQTFAFCRSLLELNSYRLYLNTLIAFSSVIATYALGQYVNEKGKLFKRPFYIRYALYPVVGLIGYGLFGFVTDFYTFQREKRIDQKLAKLEPDMIEAGISFYTKLMNKTNAIRELSGQDTNTINWLGFRTTPIAQRKDFFEKKLKELQAKTAAD